VLEAPVTESSAAMGTTKSLGGSAEKSTELKAERDPLMGTITSLAGTNGDSAAFWHGAKCSRWAVNSLRGSSEGPRRARM
jgi:hypothetical protein